MSKITIQIMSGKKINNKKKPTTPDVSQAVTHPSTDPARRCLTSVIGREPVHSAWYGRRRRNTLLSGLQNVFLFYCIHLMAGILLITVFPVLFYHVDDLLKIIKWILKPKLFAYLYVQIAYLPHVHVYF